MSQERRLILALFAIALGLRVLYAVVASTQPDVIPTPITRDLVYAREIASGFEWISDPVSPRAPGYPIALAGALFVSFDQLWLAKFFQSILGALAVVLVFVMGRRFLGTTVAVIAALWMAISVQHMHYSAVLERDVLASLLLLVLLVLLVRPFEKMRYGLIAGLVYAVLIHVDPQYLLLFPLFIVFIFFKSRHRLLNVQYAFLFVTALVLFSIPWAVRNQIVYRQPVVVAMESTRYLRPFKTLVTDTGQAMSEMEQRIDHASRTDRIETNTVEFWRFARFSNGAAAETTAAGIIRPFRPAWSLRHNLVGVLTYGLLLPFFVIGIGFVVKNRDRTGWMLLVTAAAYFLMRAYMGGSERARLPIEPIIVLIAFYGVLGLARRFRASRDEQTKPA